MLNYKHVSFPIYQKQPFVLNCVGTLQQSGEFIICSITVTGDAMMGNISTQIVTNVVERRIALVLLASMNL